MKIEPYKLTRLKVSKRDREITKVRARFEDNNGFRYQIVEMRWNEGDTHYRFHTEIRDPRSNRYRTDLRFHTYEEAERWILK